MESELIDEKIAKHNLQKIRLLCKVTSIVVLTTIILNSIQLSLLDYINLGDYLSFLPLLIMLFVNCAFMLYSKLYYKKTKYEPIHIKRLTNLYVFILLLSGVVITVSDPEIYTHMLFFSLIVITASSYFIIHKKYLYFVIFVNSFLLAIGLYHQQGFSEHFQKQMLYIALLIPITIYISRAFYRSHINTFQAQVQLEIEIKANRELAQELIELNHELSQQSLLDSMTSIYNRKALNEHIEKIALQIDEEPIYITIVMLDVDYFKQYNDTYGHIKGDQVLIQIAERLQKVAEEHGGFLARYGGEEFTIVLINVNESCVQSVCEKSVKYVEQLQIPHAASEVAPFVTLSVGAYSQLAENRKEVLETLQMADKLLYEVKNNGRNGYEANFVVES